MARETMASQSTETEQVRAEPLWKRLIWFASFWLLGVGAVSAVAYGIRLVIKSQFPDS